MKKKFAPLERIVEIDWVDSSSTNGWGQPSRHTLSKVDFDHKSVGYLFYEDELCIAIAQSKAVAEDGNIDDVIHIPKVAITKIRTLK